MSVALLRFAELARCVEHDRLVGIRGEEFCGHRCRVAMNMARKDRVSEQQGQKPSDSGIGQLGRPLGSSLRFFERFDASCFAVQTAYFQKNSLRNISA